ncbi:ionotropic receptor 21a isoform X2 [Lepeophtheirus salmonis]|uniref:ionotropic receptor 21a isoform X2 n=1 Tax=Lepeophtheirus salmonis TaxID=72036 RepID=UPI001AE899C1|nr:ionotropic receptor 21a-like [Lepeophtheirus salmonis]
MSRENIWDKALVSYNQKYIFITDRNSFKQLLKLKEMRDVFYLLIITIDEALNTGFFYLYTSDPIHDGEYTRLGAWITRFIKTSDDIFPNKFSDMKGKVLPCAYLPFFPYIYEERLHPKSLDLMISGVEHDILSQFKKILNFNVKYIRAPDGNYGVKNSTKDEFNGMIGMAQRQEVDICLGTIVRSYEREIVIDFSETIFFTTTTFITRNPAPLPKWQAILSPFQPSLWIALVFGMLSFFVINYLFIKWTLIPMNEVTLTYSFLSMWASFMNQGIPHPKLSSYRVLLASWFLFSLCVVSSYAGSLFSSLTLPRYEVAIDSLNQLLNSNLKIIVLKGKYHEQYFQNSNVKLYQRLYEQLYKGPSVCNTFKDCLFYVNDNTGYSFIFEKEFFSSKMPTIFPDSNHKIRISRRGFHSTDIATVFRKNNPIRHEYNKFILKIRQAGLVSLWRKKHQFKKRMKNRSVHKHSDDLLDENDEGKKILTMEHLQGVFFLYAFGIGFSILTYFYEKKKHRI